jgi:hypothetical protein
MFDSENYAALFTTARLVKRIGWRRADELLGFMHDYKQFIVAHDRYPTSFAEYVAWTRAFSRRTCFTRLALLHKAYPELGPDSKPEDFLAGFLDRIQTEIDGAEIDGAGS